MSYNTFPPQPFPPNSEGETGAIEEIRETLTEVQEDISDLNTDVGNLNTTKTNQITIAPAFNAEQEYSVDDIVYYNGLSYRCVNAHTGAWDAEDFTPTTIENEIKRVNSDLPDNPTVDGKNLLLANTVSGETTKSWISESSFLKSQGNKTVDCNTETSNAIIRVRDTSTNMPTGAVDGILIVFKPLSDNVCVQLFVESSGKVSERINWYSTWSSWKTVVS